MAPQDTFIDDEDDTCPLCIEEFDLSDRNFRPCPCGYQICQFCFNNIKQNMNSLCPACRRPYDDKTIQFKVVSSEEIAEFRNNIQKNQKKRAAEQRQKELQKREAEKENRKNLVGVRVVQKNLVYVTGLNPTVREDELLRTLRKPEFFGQYGNIQKISISNRKSPDGSASLGIYVTFEKKDEAQRCIQAVNGSVNGERTLKAQLGTTKYCSAWLRHEQCTNRQCMFLHELGDEEDSYTRQDLSSMNSINSQVHAQGSVNGSSSRSASRMQSHPVSGPPAASATTTAASVGTPTSSAAQPMTRSASKEGSENDDASALPSSASWARNPQVRSRRGSYATSGAASSPAISMSLPVTSESVAEAVESPIPTEASLAVPSARAQGKLPADGTASGSNAGSGSGSGSGSSVSKPAKERKAKSELDPLSNLFLSLLQAMEKCSLPPTLLLEGLSLDAHPPLFDPRGGEKRRALQDDESRPDVEPEEQPVDVREPSEDEPESSGSLALGGEPEDREQRRVDHSYEQRRGGPPPPIQRNNAESLFGTFASNYLQNANPGTIGNRTVTPQQALYPRTPTGFVDHPPPGIAPSQSLFQGQVHNRQPSRFGFGGDGAPGGTTTIKLAANPRLMAQQSSMMAPSLHGQNGPYYTASMPGPPPGLKSTGTPLAMFGHGGFGTSGFGGGNPKDARDTSQLLQDIIRTRGSASSQGHDAGKLDLADPSILQARLPHQQSNAGVGQGLFGGQAQEDELPAFDEAVSIVDALVADEPPSTPAYGVGLADSPMRLGTPSFPPGFGPPALGPHGGVIGGDYLPVSMPPPGFGGPPQTPSAMLPNAVIPPPGMQGHGPLPGPMMPPRPTMPMGLSSIPPAPISAPVSAPIHVPIESPSTPKTATPRVTRAVTASTGSPMAGSSASAGAASTKQSVLHDEDFPALDAAAKPSASVAPAISSSSSSATASRKVTRAAPKNAAASTTAEGVPSPASPSGVVAPAPAASDSKKDKSDRKVSATAAKVSSPLKAPPAETVQAAPIVASAPSPAPAPSVGVASDGGVSAEAFPSLPTPSAVVAAPPGLAMRAAPKTLRVVQSSSAGNSTAKTPVDTAAAEAGGSGSSTMKGRPASMMHSSSSGGASNSGNRPDTPASEGIISDSISVASASVSVSVSASMPLSVPVSRASSPPPSSMSTSTGAPTTPSSRIGSAAIRTTTKSQQRKQRKQATKKESATIASQPVLEQQEEEEIAPIMGRKKKQKKEKPSKIESGNADAAGTAEEREKERRQKEAEEKKRKEAEEKEKRKLREDKEREEKEKKESKKKKDEEEKKKKAAAAAAASSKAQTQQPKQSKHQNTKILTSAAGALTETGNDGEVKFLGMTIGGPAVKMREREEEALQEALEEAARVAGTDRILKYMKLPTATMTRMQALEEVMEDEMTVYQVVREMVRHQMLGEDRALEALWKVDGLGDMLPWGDAGKSKQNAASTSTPESAPQPTIIGDAMLQPEIVFTDEDRQELLADRVVRKVIDGVRLLVTPNGDCLRNLTAEEEDRFLQLQRRVGESARSPLSYFHPRYAMPGGFTLISKRAVPCGVPGYYPAAAAAALEAANALQKKGSGSRGGGQSAAANAGSSANPITSKMEEQIDPVIKIQRDEAVYWINQYVLPRLNLLPPCEAATWQTMLADTGMPESIGTSTVAPWIYHTPETRSFFSEGHGGEFGTSGNYTHHSGVAHSHGHEDDDDLVEDDDEEDDEECDGHHEDDHENCTDEHYAEDHDHHHGHHHHHECPHHHYHHDSLHHHHHGDYEDDEDEDLEHSVRAMTVEEAEMSLMRARQDAATLDRALKMLVRKNHRMVMVPYARFTGVGGETGGSSGVASAAAVSAMATVY